MENTAGTAQGYAFQQWLRNRVRSDISAPAFPEKKEELPAYRRAVRKIFETAAGPVPEYDSLDAKIHQAHRRKGYRIEAVSFPTFAGLRMTATAYVPDTGSPVPGILAVHGHSAHGRRDARMQTRCAALAKLGYFVLAVDAFGNGERSIQLPGEYHGDNYAAALWLTGYSLFGIQIHENYRACDYLASRPEVDSARLGISGASGGGNQSFYSGAWDSRFTAVVPVCSTGAYRKLVGTHNCMCETPFGMAGKLEQFDIFASTAPRALLVISARADGVSFRFEDAGATMEKAARVWELEGCPEKTEFEALPINHGYPPMAREKCIRWFNRWLKDIDTPELVKEPDVPVEDYASISCYPDASTTEVMTMPAFFSRKREEVLKNRVEPSAKSVAKIFTSPGKMELEVEPVSRIPEIIPGSTGVSRLIKGADGTLVSALCYWPDYTYKTGRAMIIVSENKNEQVEVKSGFIPSSFAQKALVEKMSVWAVDLPGLGEGQLKGENPGYRSAARACHLLGFSLAGYWLSLIKSLAEAAKKEADSVWLSVSGAPSTAVLAGASLLDEIDRLFIFNPLSSCKTGDTFENIPLASLIPGLLQAGDIPELAALAAPKPMTVAAPLSHDGTPLPQAEMHRIFEPVIRSYKAKGRPDAFHIISKEESTSTFLPGLAG